MLLSTERALYQLFFETFKPSAAHFSSTPYLKSVGPVDFQNKQAGTACVVIPCVLGTETGAEEKQL